MPSRDLANEAKRYDPVAIALHWVMFLLLIWVGVLGLLHDTWPKRTQSFWINMHALFGLIAWALLITRCLCRIKHPPPVLPKEAGEFFLPALNPRSLGALWADVHYPHHRRRNFHLTWSDIQIWPVSNKSRRGLQSRGVSSHGRYSRLSGVRPIHCRGNPCPRRAVASLRTAGRRSQTHVAKGI